jgi:CysZ protein
MQLSRLFLPVSSVGFLAARPALWWLVLTPAAISSVLLVLMMWMAYAFGLEEIIGRVEPTSDGWWANVGADLAVAAGAIILFIAALLATWVLASLVAGPFCDVLGERIEHELLASRPDLRAPALPLWESLIHTLRETFRRVLVATPIVLVGLMFELIPVVGFLIAPIITIPSLLLFLSLDAFSYPLDRRRIPMREKIDFLKANRRSVIPLSAGLVPFTFPLCCPPLVLPSVAAIAATRLYCEVLLATAPPPPVPAPQPNPAPLAAASSDSPAAEAPTNPETLPEHDPSNGSSTVE